MKLSELQPGQFFKLRVNAQMLFVCIEQVKGNAPYGDTTVCSAIADQTRTGDTPVILIEKPDTTPQNDNPES